MPVFRTPTSVDTRLGQIREWADLHRVDLKWADEEQPVGSSRTWSSYPIIQGHHYPAFTGKGPQQRHARDKAAEMIYQSGTLDMARARAPATPVHIAPAHH